MISGAGNVACHAAEKFTQVGGKVLTLSDSDGFIYDPDGIDREKIDWVQRLKGEKRGRIREYVDEFPRATYGQENSPGESRQMSPCRAPRRTRSTRTKP